VFKIYDIKKIGGKIMKKWFVESYTKEELQENLTAFTKQGCEIFKIFKETYDYLVIAYKEIK
jgi:hypothetical protein